MLAWLRGRKPHLSSRTLRLVLNLLERAIRYAQVQEMVARNVAELARLDQRGRLKGDKPGRPSKSMTLEQAAAVLKAAEGTRWYAYLVFCTRTGTPLDHHNVLRDLRTVMRKAGLNQDEWTARRLRHTFVSLLSDHGVSIEEISLLVGHDGTDTTERVYRHQLRPVRRSAAKAMDKILHDVG
ncbi:tyrosine-type recombinase/integrase [Nocardiopsis dassonvillei]|uniref:tyrosine-type recombinase/integrase n=1 Tax=Nocardiopsis dassonvillei TaxID=2014 RepID=UPI0037020760